MASEVRAAARAVDARRRAKATAASSCRAKTGTATSTPAAGRASVALRAFMKRGPRGAGTESVPTVHGDPPHQRRAPARALRVPAHPERLVRRRRPRRPRAGCRVGLRARARGGGRGGAPRLRPQPGRGRHDPLRPSGRARTSSSTGTTTSRRWRRSRPGTRRRSSPSCATATSTRAGRRTTRATSTRCSRRWWTWHARGELAVDVTVASDGEEEIGGDSVVRWLDEAERPLRRRDRLRRRLRRPAAPLPDDGHPRHRAGQRTRAHRLARRALRHLRRGRAERGARRGPT